MPSNHPSCASIDSLITPFIDGELNPVDRQLIEHHLSRCGACRSRVEAERSVHDLMKEPKTAWCHGPVPAILGSVGAAAARFNTAGAKSPASANAVGANGGNRVRFGRRAWAWMAPLTAAAS